MTAIGLPIILPPRLSHIYLQSNTEKEIPLTAEIVSWNLNIWPQTTVLGSVPQCPIIKPHSNYIQELLSSTHLRHLISCKDGKHLVLSSSPQPTSSGGLSDRQNQNNLLPFGSQRLIIAALPNWKYWNCMEFLSFPSSIRGCYRGQPFWPSSTKVSIEGNGNHSYSLLKIHARWEPGRPCPWMLQ